MWMGSREATIVPPDGNPFGKLAIVGARPGREEVRRGRPFIGPSGDLLFRLLPLCRDAVYITNVRKDYNPARALPTRSEIHEVLDELRDELSRTTSNCILALGNEALYATTGKWGIDNYRGSILPSTLVPGRKVVCAWHPANVLRTYERIYTLDADLKRACEQAEFPELRRPERRFHLDPSLDEVLSFLRSLGDEVTIDVETPRSNTKIVYCLGLGDSASEAMCIPFIGGRLLPRELVHVLRELQSLFKRSRVRGQNVGFDIWRLEQLGLRIPHISIDTMLAHHLLWPEAGLKRKDDQGKESFSGGHGLDFIASVYTEEPYYKDEGQDWREFSGDPDWLKLWRYNLKDVCVTHEAADALIEELKEFNQYDYFVNEIQSLIRPVWRMQQTGFFVDLPRLSQVKHRLELENKVLQLRLNREVGFECNVRSPYDMRYLVYDLLGNPVKKRTKKAAKSVDKETLLTLAYEGSQNGPLRRALEVRERRTLLSGFMQMEVNDEGRYTAPYLIHGTDSGRLSCRSPKGLDGRAGPQLQNAPKRVRVLFRARPGHFLWQADLRRAEAMYVAYDAPDLALIAIFEDPTRDLYSELASEFLGIPIEMVAKGSIERECFKAGAHASNYGMRWKRYISLLRVKRIDIEEVQVKGLSSNKAKAEFFLESYHQKFPGIRERLRRVERDVFSTRTLVSALGRRRFFMGRKDDNLVRIAASFDPQATVVGVTNRALRYMDSKGYTLCGQVHDSLIGESPIDQKPALLADVQRAFHIPITRHGRTFTIPIDVQIGENWGEMKEVDPSELATALLAMDGTARSA